MNNDLTIGKPETVLWKFCLPLFLSVIFQQLYNIADSFVAGRFVGEQALAAVGNSYEITLIFIAFSMGCNIGCSVLVSQLFGGKKFADMKSAISTVMISCGVLCAFLMIFGLSCGAYLLQLINTADDIFADSQLYLNIYILGLPFLMFYNISTGIFAALGDSKTPFYFLAFSSTANIIVDIIFVSAFDMGVAGVAWATFLCQGISCILALVVIVRRLRKIDALVNTYFSVPLFKRFLVFAIPSIMQQSCISIANIMIQSLINSCGVGVTAGYAAAIKLNNLVITSFTTLGNGISNYTAQNIGAQKLERVRSGFLAGIKMVWTICVPIVLIYLFGAHILMNIFINNPSDLALESGSRFLYIAAPFYFMISVKLSTDGVLRGAGLMKYFVIATFTDLVLRVILAFVLVGPLGYMGIWLSWPIGWAIGVVLSLYFYKSAWKKNIYMS